MHTNSKTGQSKAKTKIHHGGTETRRRSKPIFTTEGTEGHGGELENQKLASEGAEGEQSNKIWAKNEEICD